jgi:hypothetical protein
MGSPKIRKKRSFTKEYALQPWLEIVSGDPLGDPDEPFGVRGVGDCFVLDEPGLVRRVESHGLFINPLHSDAAEKVFLSILNHTEAGVWEESAEERGQAFLRDIASREAGDLAEGLAAMGRHHLVRLGATRDGAKLIVQMNRQMTVLDTPTGAKAVRVN